MQQYTLAVMVFGVASVFLSASTTAYLISCPPNDLMETTPTLRNLCYAIERAFIDNVGNDEPNRRLVERDGSSLAQRNMNTDTKRQDVDHVFLRFGRRFGL